MNMIKTTNSGDPVTMTSREIAELCGKQHHHVLRDIKITLEALEIDASKFGGIYLDAHKREKPQYVLPKDLTMTVVSGYSIKFRHKIIKRLEELESQTAKPVEMSRIELLQMALESEQEKEALMIENQRQECTITNLTPKAESFDRFLNADGLVGLQNAMRTISAKPRLAIKFLKDKGHLFREGINQNTPNSYLRQQGYMRVVPVKNHISGKSYPQTYVTTRGLAWLDKVVPGDVRLNQTETIN